METLFFFSESKDELNFITYLNNSNFNDLYTRSWPAQRKKIGQQEDLNAMDLIAFTVGQGEMVCQRFL
jgi:hypothetical protein